MSRRMFLSLLGFTLLLASLVFTPMLVLANPADPGNNYYPANEGETKTLASEPIEAEPISNPQLYAGMIHRPEPMLATVKFRSDKDGSFYFLVTDTATKPSTEILTSWTTIGPIKADQSIDLKITGMGFGPKYIHGVLEDDANNLSNIITFFIPANYYYWENFESYPVGSTNFNTGDLLLPFKFIHSGSSWANQKIIENSGSNDSRFLTMSSGSNYTSDAAMPLEIGFAQSDKLYAIEYLAQPMQQNARNGELRLHTGSGSHGTLTDALDLEFRNGKLESLIVNDSNNSNVQTLLDDYTSEQWYQIKILIDTEKKLYSVYVDGELKASDLDAIGDYTYLNLTSGFSSTIRFDNLEIYVVEVRPPKPQLQSAQTSIDGQNIRLTFDLDMASDPMADGFILEADGIAHTIKSADLAINRKSIYLNLETAIKYDQEIKLSYAPGSVKSEDGGPLLAFSDFDVLNLTHRKYYFTLPEPITVNGITISLILDPSEPAVSGTPIEAKINFKGTVILGGKHFVEIFKDTPQYAQNNRIYDRNVKTGEDYDFNILMGRFYFSEDISDFGLHHSFQAQDFPVLTSAETKTDGSQIILTFDWNMANPAGSQNDFAVEVDGEANLVTSCLLGSGPNVIYLNLKDKIDHGQTVKVSYTPGTLSSALGGTLQAFSDQPVNNTVIEPTYDIFIAALSGGQITANLGTARAGTKVELTITPDPGKRLKAGSLVYKDSEDNPISGTDFIMPKADVVINAQFEDIPYEPPVYEPEPPVEPPRPLYHAELTAAEQEETPLPVSLDEENTQAYVELAAESFADQEITITIPQIPEINRYAIGIPVERLSTKQRESSITLITHEAEVTLPSNMLTGLDVTGELANLKIEAGDKTLLNEKQQDLVGNRPLLQFSLSVDQNSLEFNNPQTQIVISLAYTPTEEELESPESIIICHLDSQGQIQIIPNGHYNPDTDFVTFKTTHFSNYAIAFNPIAFNDLSPSAWYTKAVDFLAAREITIGTGQGMYSPLKELTRAEFLALLLNSYNIPILSDYEYNFDDAGNTWYTNYLGAAKELKLSKGVGHNLYEPNRNITRLEMITLLFNTLKTTNQLPTALTDRIPAALLDRIDISQMAEEILATLIADGQLEGFEPDQLNLQATITRGEIALVLYHLLTAELI